MTRTNTPATPAMTAINQFGNGLPPTSFSSGTGLAGTEIEIEMVSSFHSRYKITVFY